VTASPDQVASAVTGPSATASVWLALVGLGLSALFAALNLCVREAARVRLQELAQARGPGSVQRVRRILEDVDGHAMAVSLPRIIANLMVVVGLLSWSTGLGTSPETGWGEVAASLAAAAVLIWLFGSVLPAAVAQHAAERTVLAWAWLVRASYELARPFGGVRRFLDEAVRRLVGAEERDESRALEAELMSVVEEGKHEGQFDDAERDMIEAVVRFKDRTVAQIMTPRTEIEALELGTDLGTLIQLIRQTSHSRIPVYDGSLDQIVGIFYVKDLMRWLAGEGGGGTRGSGRPFDLRSILRPALFVPEAKTIRELLDELIAKKVHIAMVADEYGGTAGLVTIEDIVEEVFGEIWDEYELEAETRAGASVDERGRSAVLEARLRIDEANDALKALGVALPESEEYDTVGGFVLTELGRIPAAGESFRHGPLLLTVLEAEPTRVGKVGVRVMQEEAGEGIAAGMPAAGADDPEATASEPRDPVPTPTLPGEARPGAEPARGSRTG